MTSRGFNASRMASDIVNRIRKDLANHEAAATLLADAEASVTAKIDGRFAIHRPGDDIDIVYWIDAEAFTVRVAGAVNHALDTGDCTALWQWVEDAGELVE